MLAAIEAHSEMIQSEVLALKLIPLDKPHQSVNAGGEHLAIAVAKAET